MEGQGGQNRKDFRVTVYDVNFCGGRKAEEKAEDRPKYSQGFEELPDDGELPF